MLDRSFTLGLKTDCGLFLWRIAHKEEWIHGVGARASFFLRSRSFFKNPPAVYLRLAAAECSRAPNPQRIRQ